MKINWIATASALAFAVSTALHADVLPRYQTDSDWYADAQIKLAAKLQTNNQFKAKNVILFVGDGMGVSTLTAARI
jgi:alkaline phosphatase